MLKGRSSALVQTPSAKPVASKYLPKQLISLCAPAVTVKYVLGGLRFVPKNILMMGKS